MLEKLKCSSNLCGIRVYSNLEITSVRSSLDIGKNLNRKTIYWHSFSFQKAPSRFFIFATCKFWIYLVQVFLVGFSSFLLFDYTSLMSEEMMRIIGKLGLRHSKSCENQRKGRTKKTMLKWGKSSENFWCNLEPRNFHITEK